MDKSASSPERVRSPRLFAVSFGLLILLLLIGVWLALPRMAPSLVLEHSPFFQRRLVAAENLNSPEAYVGVLTSDWNRFEFYAADSLLHRDKQFRIATLGEVVLRRHFTPAIRELCAESFRTYRDKETLACLYYFREENCATVLGLIKELSQSELEKLIGFWECPEVISAVGTWEKLEVTYAGRIGEPELQIFQCFLKDVSNAKHVVPVLEFLNARIHRYAERDLPKSIVDEWRRCFHNNPTNATYANELFLLLNRADTESMQIYLLSHLGDQWAWGVLFRLLALDDDRFNSISMLGRSLCRRIEKVDHVEVELIGRYVELTKNVGVSFMKSFNESAFLNIYQLASLGERAVLCRRLSPHFHGELYLRLCKMDADAWTYSDLHSRCIRARSSSDSIEVQALLIELMQFVWLELQSEEAQSDRYINAMWALERMCIRDFSDLGRMPISDEHLLILIQRCADKTGNWGEIHMSSIFGGGIYNLDLAKNGLLGRMEELMYDDPRAAARCGMCLSSVLRRIERREAKAEDNGEE